MKKILAGAFIVAAGLFMLSAPNVMAQLPCTADFDNSGSVDADDVAEFLTQFGRSPYNDPCPGCFDSLYPCTPAPVPRTGQTASYLTGDDGYFEKGVAWPNPRFTDNLDGTVTDNLTQLIWLKNRSCFSLVDWVAAIAASNGLASGSCGLTDGSAPGDWRLPNINEFKSLLQMSPSGIHGYPKLPPGHPFSIGGHNYWTSTTFIDYRAYPGEPEYDNQAWSVSLYDGDSTYMEKAANNRGGSAILAWPVRGGHITTTTSIPWWAPCEQGDCGEGFCCCEVAGGVCGDPEPGWNILCESYENCNPYPDCPDVKCID